MPSVVIDKDVKEYITKLVRNEETIFAERGGTLLGTYDGKIIYVSELIEDYDAHRSSASINFSYDHHIISMDREMWYRRLNINLGSNKYVGRLGTWHTHPPGYGARYSSTDQHKLFLEWMILSTDDPSDGLIPKIHIIACNTEPNIFRIYALEVGANFDMDNIEILDIKSKIDTNLAILIQKNGDIVEKEYFPWYFEEAIENNSLFGLRVTFSYDHVPERLEKMILENFFLKIPRSKRNNNYTYCRISTGNKNEHFTVRRNPPEDVAWRHVEINLS